MKFFYVFPCLLLLLSVAARSAETLHIKSGETYVVPLSQSQLHLKKLRIEDGVNIQFAEGVKHWQVTAEHAEIGSGVSINASGKAGKNGADGANYNAAADDCESGRAGASGGNGGAGEAGVAITLNLMLSKLGSLEIDARGGIGGRGGHGGSGQAAGAPVKCKAPQGGNGGAGGLGGNGGDGGLVTFAFSFATNTEPFDVASALVIKNSAGFGGAGGNGGEPGIGTEGRYVTMRTLTGNKRWVAGGAPGEIGRAGNDGIAGNAGVVAVSEKLEQKLLRLVRSETARKEAANDEAKSRNLLKVGSLSQEQQHYQQLLQTINRLSQQVNALQQRVELLERATANR